MVSHAFLNMELGRVSLINNHGLIGGQPHTMWQRGPNKENRATFVALAGVSL